MSSAFYTLFNEIQSYAPSFNQGRHELSNHAPMTVLALNRLGAKDYNIHEYFKEYKSKLQKRALINEQNFYIHLGRKEYFYDYYKFFKKALIQYGVEKCITKFLKKLMSGVITASFHPWIRLSYGVTLLRDYPRLAQKEIAISLAYWCAHYTPLVTNYSGVSLPWPDVVEVVCRYIKPSETVEQAIMLYEKLNKLSQEDTFTRQVPTVEVIDVAAITLQLENFVRLLYMQYSHLSSLHGVTAVYALRILLPYIKTDRTAIQSFCQAILALYCCCHSVKVVTDSIENEHFGNEEEWLSLKRHAINSGDDHVIKLVYVCWQYKQEFARDEYVSVARKVVSEYKKQYSCEAGSNFSIVESKVGYWQTSKERELNKPQVRHNRSLSF